MKTVKVARKNESGEWIYNDDILVATDEDLLEMLQLHKNVSVMMEALSARMDVQRNLIDILNEKIELMQGQL